MLRSPRCNKHGNKSCSNVICHQHIRLEGAQLPLLLFTLGFGVQDPLFSLPINPVIPAPGIPFAPLSSRPQLGDCLFKVAHDALLVGKHCDANAGGYASAAQIEL